MKEKPKKKGKRQSYWDMRTKALLRLAGPTGLNPYLTRVLAYLISKDNATHQVVWPSQATIAVDTHLSVRTIKRALAVAEAIGAIGTIYKTRSAALADGIPVSRTGNQNLDVIRVYYDWDGYQGKLGSEMVDAINAVLERRATLLPSARPEDPASLAAPAGPPGPSQRGPRGLVNGAHGAHERSSYGGGKREPLAAPGQELRSERDLPKGRSTRVGDADSRARPLLLPQEWALDGDSPGDPS